jgi:hypothetical protein
MTRPAILAAIFLMFTAVTVQAQSVRGVVICASDVPPEDMVIIATGTSPVCPGACRARKIERVHGDIMIICARQPIPKDYVLDSVTTNPACQCVADEDNAYVIRREKEEAQPTTTPRPRPLPTPPPEIQPFREGE